MVKKKKFDNAGIIIIGVLVLGFLFLGKGVQTGTITTIEGDPWDISAQVEEKGYTQYLVEEEDFDYTHPLIWGAAQVIKESSSSAEQAIKNTAKHVVNNINYGYVEINTCYNEKASDVVQRGVGDCVSMSRVVTSLLRAQGIPARTMGGCVSFKSRCNILFAAVPYQDPAVAPLVEGDFKKRGFLHEWVEAWEPTRGWVLIEATSGQIYPLDCGQYYEYGYDSNRFNRCVINDASFWSMCKDV